MKLGEKIRALRNEENLSQKELGKRIGVSEISVRCWENGTKNPSINALAGLAELFNVSADYLLGIFVDDDDKSAPLRLSNNEKRLISAYRTLDEYGREAVNTICLISKTRIEGEDVNRYSDNQANVIVTAPTRYIPKYVTPAAAGYSVPLDGRDFEMIIVDSTMPPEVDFAVKIQGNSMSPLIKDGDTVYVKKNCDVGIGDIGIFCVDGSMYCKQYYIDDNNNLTLISLNPEFKETNVHISADSNSDVRCYGKVLFEHKVELPDYLFE